MAQGQASAVFSASPSGPAATGSGPADDLTAWAESGAAFLTGREEGPALGPPAGFVGRLRAIADVIAERSAVLGRKVELDPPTLLAERAAIAGLRRRGDVSCGGAARLLPTTDGWLCVNLPRSDDLELLPAWLATVGPPRDPASAGLPRDPASAPGPDASSHARRSAELWAAVAGAAGTAPGEELTERAQLLGLAVSALPHRAPVADDTAHNHFGRLPVTAHSIEATSGPAGERGLRGVVIADLSSLWAGPLCSRVLQEAGARVIKVESTHRPDGARRGPEAFFDRLHAGQESVALDFRTAAGRDDLRRLLGAVDIVIEGSRPRALEQVGVVAVDVLRGERGPRVWLSITGYGRDGAGRDKVAFGDDAAVAGGLVAWDEIGPCFLADAVADPCAGLVAAAATLCALAGDGRWLLDVALCDVAAHLAGADPFTSRLTLSDHTVASPRITTASGRAPALGEHTTAVLKERLGQ